MADCGKCKVKSAQAADVPYIVHEASMARSERTVKRLWATIILLILLFVGSNAAWIWWNNQWETVESWEITQENEDGNNNYIGHDGDIENGETDHPQN